MERDAHLHRAAGTRSDVLQDDIVLYVQHALFGSQEHLVPRVPRELRLPGGVCELQNIGHLSLEILGVCRRRQCRTCSRFGRAGAALAAPLLAPLSAAHAAPQDPHGVTLGPTPTGGLCRAAAPLERSTAWAPQALQALSLAVASPSLPSDFYSRLESLTEYMHTVLYEKHFPSFLFWNRTEQNTCVTHRSMGPSLEISGFLPNPTKPFGLVS